MAIGPVSPLTPGIGAPAVGGIASSSPASPASPSSVDFGDVLRTSLDKVDGHQQDANAAISDLLAGKTSDTIGVVSAVAESDMSFKLLLGVRNKVIEAYKQTMNMQI